jgi:hypothetical protein
MKYENGALSLILKIRRLQQTGGWKYVILMNSYGRGYRRRLHMNKKSLVSIVKYEKPLESVRKAVELSHGLDHLSADARVFIKPPNGA